MLILAAAVVVLAMLMYWLYQRRKPPPDRDLEELLEALDLENRKIGDLMLDVETLEEETGSDFSRILENRMDRFSHLAPRYREIIRLHQNGETAGEIARKIGAGEREVQLIIKMQRKEVRE